MLRLSFREWVRIEAGMPIGQPASLPGEASGLMAIATAAKQVVADGMQVIGGGGMGAAGLFEVLRRLDH